MSNETDHHLRAKRERLEVRQKLLTDVPRSVDESIRSYLKVPIQDRLSEKSLTEFAGMLLEFKIISKIDLTFLRGRVVDALGKEPFTELWYDRMELLQGALKDTGDHELIQQFVKRFGSEKDEKNITLLKQVLSGRNWDIEIDDLVHLLDWEANDRLDETLRKHVFPTKSISLEEALNRYLERFDLEDEQALVSLAYALRDFGFPEYISPDGKTVLFEFLLAELKMEAQRIEVTRFESRLADEDGFCSLEMVDNFTGYEFEDFLRKLFSKAGYQVEHTQVSKDQGADIVIEKFGEKTVIQAKRQIANVGNSAVQEIVAAIGYYEAQKGAVLTNSYFTGSAIQLALANKIKLIDRESLQTLIDSYW
ncbi:MAG: restriction endonuclease [Pyrinomonadaceae bacterium]